MDGRPRLLIVQRRTRSIGPIASIVKAAEVLGFDVAFMYFDGLRLVQQLRLARLADVFLSIHGMALTWAFSMDGSAPESRGCRTLIELRHFVRPFPTKLRFYKHIASSTNLSYDEVAATGCRFGRSVVKPEKEYRSLFRASHVFGLKGFHDQAAFFNLSEVRLALAAAFKRAQGCPR
jgi:hypothetical protein